jgi:hypothetical protein
MFKPTFQNSMAILNEQYSSQNYVAMTDAKISIFWHVLQKYDLQDIENAVFSWIADPVKSKFQPKAGELTAFLPEIKPLQIERKSSVTGCDNCERLMAKYPYVRQEKTA